MRSHSKRRRHIISHDAAALHRRHERKIPYVVRRHLTVRSTESFLRTTYGIWRNAAVPKAIAAKRSSEGRDAKCINLPYLEPPQLDIAT